MSPRVWLRAWRIRRRRRNVPTWLPGELSGPAGEVRRPSGVQS